MTSAGTNVKVRFVVRLLLYWVLGVYALTSNPFDLSAQTDKISQDAVYRVMAPFYPPAARDDIVVVLLNDIAIEALYRNGIIQANEWPLRYRDHGTLLSRIASYEPRAVFVDIYFKKERSLDDSLPQMEQRLARYQQRYGTHFLFAGGEADERLSPIQQRLGERFALTVNGWRGFGAAYPLQVAGRGTAAMDLYRIACLSEQPMAGCSEPRLEPRVVDGEALSLRWGAAPAPPPFPEYAASVCDSSSGSFAGFVRQLGLGLVSGLAGFEGASERLRVKCPFHATLFADELLNVESAGTPEERRRLAALLHGKIVLYGVSLRGLHDVVLSPVHGKVDGVMAHAMALDNLMYFGSAYTRAADERLETFSLAAWFVILLMVTGVAYWVESGAAQAAAAVPKSRAGRRLQALRYWRHLLVATGVVSVGAVSLAMFTLLDYEPMNSLGFIGLLAVVGSLMRAELADGLVRTVQRAAKRLRLRCMRFKEKPGGRQHGQD